MLFKQNVHRTSLALVIIPEIRFTGMHRPPQFSSVPAKVCIQAPVPVPDSDISLLSFLRKQESINPTLPELKSPKCDSQPCIAHHSSVPYRRKSVSRLLCLYLTRIFPYCRSCESRNLSIQPCLSYPLKYDLLKRRVGIAHRLPTHTGESRYPVPFACT
jgi:hypothetical protein